MKSTKITGSSKLNLTHLCTNYGTCRECANHCYSRKIWIQMVRTNLFSRSIHLSIFLIIVIIYNLGYHTFSIYQSYFCKRIFRIVMKNVTLRLTRPTLEQPTTIGRLRSIKPNMINHFANQSQTSELFKSIFLTLKKESCVISGWTDIENPYRLLRG